VLSLIVTIIRFAIHPSVSLSLTLLDGNGDVKLALRIANQPE
jgi:hypothetical protein